MESRIQERRKAAMAVRVASLHLAHRRSLTDPMFNLREIAKQLLLLEDHLSHPYKLCQDCVRKHLLTTEALAEEASAMDTTKDPIVVGLSEGIAEAARIWLEELSDGKDPKEVAILIRGLRKHLVAAVYDPRVDDAAVRVASVYTQRGRCSHKS